jgi:uncharacterized protein YacL
MLRAGFILTVLGLSLLLRPYGAGLFRPVLVPALFGLSALVVERMLQRVHSAALLVASLSLVLGLCLGALLASVLSPAIPSSAAPFFRLLLPLCTGFLGLSAGVARASSFDLPGRHLIDKNAPSTTNTVRCVDTSALIDGRIADLAEAGFLDGALVIPQFVLNELQTVADAADSGKRNRGRRGLDVVARLQKVNPIRVEISPVDYRDTREVDLKLIEAAKTRNAQIVTTDFNLSKLAQVQGIRVLNVNELAIALRPVVLQGETMRVLIAKEGKESNQGVAYLDDGTMIVVENARRQLAKTIEVVVTGIVQSAAGKMIFARYEDGRSSSRGLATDVAESTNFQAS